jgi:hypothetical protein
VEQAAHPKHEQRLRSAPPGLVVAGASTALTLLLAAVLFLLGGRAGGAPPDPAVPNVVGMQIAAAKRRLLSAGPVRIRVQRVPYGRAGEVLRVQGLEFDGTFNAQTTLTLQVGTKHLKPWSVTAG